MKIAIDKSALVEALDTAIKSISSKPTLPILEGFLLEADKRTLKVTGNNLETSIQFTAQCEVIRPGITVVNARLFSDIIKKMPNEEIDLNVTDKEMTIEAGKAVIRVPVVSANGYPAIPAVDAGNSIELDQQVFRELVGGTSFSVSQDDTRPILNGVLVEVSDGSLNMVAMGNYRFAMRSTQVKGDNVKMVILGKVINDIAKVMKSGTVKIYTNRGMALFETEQFTITARLLEGEFMKYQAFLVRDCETKAKIVVKDLQSVLERVMLLEPSGDRAKCPPSVLKISDSLVMDYNSQNGCMNDEVEADIEGTSVRIGVDTKVMLEILRNIEVKEIVLLLSGPKTPIKIIPVEGDGFFYLFAPVLIPGV